MDALAVFYNTLWQQYSAICPQALAIHRLFSDEGEVLINDHIAFRTFGSSNVDIEHLEPEIFALGYQYLDSYHFEAKKLDARCYVHADSPTKIFISELLWHRLSHTSQGIIQRILEQANSAETVSLSIGRLWELPSYTEYLSLLEESEYAAWLSVWGLRANHFTIFVNHLTKYPQLYQVVALLQEQGYKLNTAGGVIKGTPDDLLIQASTMADKLPVEFEDAGDHMISTCYYEFAQRFTQKDGRLYQGFVPGSADKIFESTNVNPAKISSTDSRGSYD